MSKRKYLTSNTVKKLYAAVGTKSMQMKVFFLGFKED